MIDDNEISYLAETLEKILDKAPEEYKASDEENEMFADMQNLLESTRTYLYYKARENEEEDEL